MNTTAMPRMQGVTLVGLGLAIAAMGFYVANADDAPGAAVFGLLLMAAGVVLGVRAARHRLPLWAARIALTVGVAAAAFAASLTHAVAIAAPLFAQVTAVPSVAAAAPSPHYAAAVERARDLVRAAVLAQNLPGVSVAVGTDDMIVWAEGFGWRDVGTEAPVTPDTRFNIGTAASAVAGAVASLGLTNTGVDSAADWSPQAIGEPGEDFPPFTLIRHVILQPLGLASVEYPLPGDRATFYVPRSEDNPARGRRLMAMRDLACCANGAAFYSTPSDLVRVASAPQPRSVDGELAGGTVVSLRRGPGGIVVAVTANIAHANTAALARRVEGVFSEPRAGEE